MFCGWLRSVGGTCASAAIGGALLGVTRRSARTESDKSGAPEVAIDTQTPKRDEVPQSAANATATSVEQQPKSRRLRLIKREYLTSLTRLPDRFGEAQAVDLPQNAWEYVDVLDVTELDAKSVPKVLLLSYRWRTPDHPDPEGKVHPDPEGKVLQCVQHYLKSLTDPTEVEYVFWDYLSTSGADWKGENRIGPDSLLAANTLGFHADTLVVGSPDYFDSSWCVTEFVISMLNPLAGTIVYDTASNHIKNTQASMPRDLFKQVAHGVRMLQGTSFTDARSPDEIKLATDHLHTAVSESTRGLLNVYKTTRLNTHASQPTYVPHNEHEIDLEGKGDSVDSNASTTNEHTRLTLKNLLKETLRNDVEYDGDSFEDCEYGHSTIRVTDDDTECWMCLLRNEGLELVSEYRLILAAFVEFFHELPSRQKTEVLSEIVAGLKRFLGAEPSPTGLLPLQQIHYFRRTLKNEGQPTDIVLLKKQDAQTLAVLLGFLGLQMAPSSQDVDVLLYTQRSETPALNGQHCLFSRFTLTVVAAGTKQLSVDLTKNLNQWILAQHGMSHL